MNDKKESITYPWSEENIDAFERGYALGQEYNIELQKGKPQKHISGNDFKVEKNDILTIDNLKRIVTDVK